MSKSRKHHNAQIKGLFVKLLKRHAAVGAPVEIKVPIDRVSIDIALKGPIKRARGKAVYQSGLGALSILVNGNGPFHTP